MTFKVLQCNSYMHKRNMVVHRGVIVLRYLTATGYKSALAPRSDAYFPNVRVEVWPPSNTVAPEHQGTVYPPILSYQRGEESGASLRVCFQLISTMLGLIDPPYIPKRQRWMVQVSRTGLLLWTIEGIWIRMGQQMIWTGLKWDKSRCKIIWMMLKNLIYVRYI